MIRCLVAAALAVLFTSGCVVNDSDGDGAGGGGTVSVCDGKNDCSTCTTCATMGPCAAEVSACNNSSSCQGLDQCLSLCGANPDCRSQCAASNAGGVAIYDALTACVYCGQCPDDCAGFATCN